MFAEHDFKSLVFFERFLQYLLSSRQMTNCSTLKELQYEKHFHRDGDDCGK